MWKKELCFRFGVFVGVLAVFCEMASSSAAAAPPNIVVIVSDDHGYGDSSCYEHPAEVKTPNIDRLAQQGIRFTDGYVSAYVCAPTRAGLMTGRYQQRFGFYTASDSRTGMPLSEVTLADVLKDQGYATGAFGKWHLGLEKEYHPLSRGFQEFYGFLGHGGHDYFQLLKTDDQTSIYRNWERIDDTGYLTDNLGRESVSFIERHRNEPFFLYLPFNAVHFPLQAPDEDIKRYSNDDSERNIYLAMLYRMDLAIGQVLDTLEKHGLERNTLIFFFSDNGGARNNKANNLPLRDYKHSVYEGGVRVPFIVSWPGQFEAGRVCSEPVISLDVLPTVCAAVGAKVPADRELNGKNLMPLLRGESQATIHDALYWDGDDGIRAVRAGRWKLVDLKGKYELYDLNQDLSETTDLAQKNPEELNRLKGMLESWANQNKPRIGGKGGKSE